MCPTNTILHYRVSVNDISSQTVCLAVNKRTIFKSETGWSYGRYCSGHTCSFRKPYGRIQVKPFSFENGQYSCEQCSVLNVYCLCLDDVECTIKMSESVCGTRRHNSRKPVFSFGWCVGNELLLGVQTYKYNFQFHSHLFDSLCQPQKQKLSMAFFHKLFEKSTKHNHKCSVFQFRGAVQI